MLSEDDVDRIADNGVHAWLVGRLTNRDLCEAWGLGPLFWMEDWWEVDPTSAPTWRAIDDEVIVRYARGVLSQEEYEGLDDSWVSEVNEYNNNYGGNDNG